MLQKIILITYMEYLSLILMNFIIKYILFNLNKNILGSFLI